MVGDKLNDDAVAPEGSDRPAEGRSRRQFLKMMGIGVAAGGTGIAAIAVANNGIPGISVAPSPTPAQNLAISATKGIPENARKFGIMLPSLRGEPFAHPDDTVRKALLEVGAQGGIMDAKDDLSAGALRLLLDPSVNGSPTALDPRGRSPFNPTQTHGSTFFGQLIDHDITFDATSVLGAPANPLLTNNSVTPALDLDTVFGDGPSGSPKLYGAGEGKHASARMKIGTGGVHEMFPSTANGDGTSTLLKADGRNSQTLMLEGLTVAYMKAYNRVLDELDDLDLSAFPTARQADLSNTNERYLVAREVVLWHYHWLIVNEHLPQVVGSALVKETLKKGNRFYKPPRGNAYMPIEFSSGSYRFGHSQTDPSYRANFSSGTGATSDPNKSPFYGLTFDASIPMTRFNDGSSFDRPDMLGGYPAPRRYLGWQSFFDFGDGQVLNNRRINPKITTALYTLPSAAIPGGAEVEKAALPQRNLLRVLTWALPSGQSVARELGVDPLSEADLQEIGSVYAPFATATPMWYYELAEADIVNDGLHLGPVGGRIVVETLLGLMLDDARSFLNQAPDFEPFLGTDLKFGPDRRPEIAGSRDYSHANFLYYAGVVEPGVYR